MRRFVVRGAVALAAIALVVVAAAFLGFPVRIASDDDEAPIIVRNGSMDIHAGEEWFWEEVKDQSGAITTYRYDPDHLHFDLFNGQIWVTVEGSNIVCSNGSSSLHAKTVVITYDSGFSTTFERKRRGLGTLRTVVPATGLKSVGNKLLRHGEPMEGFIRRVDVGSASCTFQNAAALTRIKVCASKKRCEEAD